MSDGSEVVCFRIHPAKDKQAYETLNRFRKQGLNTREIFTDLLNRYQGVSPEMYRAQAQRPTLGAMREIFSDELSQFGRDFLAELLEKMQDKVIEDVRAGRVNPESEAPFGDSADRTRYTDNMLEVWQSRQQD